MKKILLYAILPLVLCLIVVFGFWFYTNSTKNTQVDTKNKETVIENKRANIHDETYTIDGQQVTLKNGLSEIPAAPGSLSKVTTKYFGNDVSYDFDADGTKDIAFLITQDTGGSGTFYYVVELLHRKEGLMGTNAVLIGDRIAPQTLNVINGTLTVNYADRKAGESFTTQPSVGKSIYLKLDTKTLQFYEVDQAK